MTFDEILEKALLLPVDERTKLAKAISKSATKASGKKFSIITKPARKGVIKVGKSKKNISLDNIQSFATSWVDEEYMNWKKAEKKHDISPKIKKK